jgi:membrane protein
MAKHLHLSAKIFWQLLKITGKSWNDNRCIRLGAALAFYSILSLAPLLLLVLTVATSWWGLKAAEGQILSQMGTILGAQGAETVQNILAASDQNKETGALAAFIGLITLLFGASGVFGELQDAMNIIWKAPPRRGKAILILIRERFFSFTMVVGCGFLLLISLVISAWLSRPHLHRFPCLR